MTFHRSPRWRHRYIAPVCRCDLVNGCGTWALQEMAKEKNAEARLAEDTTASGMSVEQFIAKIMDQCREVLGKHELRSADEYLNDWIYRTLEVEMLDVKVCSRS